MPVLEITPEMMKPEQARLLITYLQSVMIWPDRADEQKRKRAREASLAAEVVRTVAREAAGQTQVSFKPDQLMEIMTFLANAPPLRNVQEETNRRLAHATVAGRIFLNMCTDEGKRIGVTAVKEEISRRLNGKQHFEHLSTATIDNTILREYRPAAHLWAAQIMCGLEYRAASSLFGFPCQTRDIPYFLALSERLRREGETSRPRQYAGTLLDPAVTWSLPSDLQLPLDATWRANGVDLSKGA